MRKLLKTEISNNREQMLTAACLLITRPPAGEPGAVALTATAHSPCASVSGTRAGHPQGQAWGQVGAQTQMEYFLLPLEPVIDSSQIALARWYLDRTQMAPGFCPQGPGRGPGIISL